MILLESPFLLASTESRDADGVNCAQIIEREQLFRGTRRFVRELREAEGIKSRFGRFFSKKDLGDEAEGRDLNGEYPKLAKYFPGFFHYEPVSPNEKGLKYIPRKLIEAFPRSIGNLVLGSSDYKFTPFRGIGYNILDRPIGWATEKWGESRRSTTILVRLPVFMAAFLWSYYSFIIDPMDAHIHEEAVAAAQAQAPYLDRLISEDYRFKPILDRYIEAEIDEIEARGKAYVLKSAHLDYMKNSNSIDLKNLSAEENMALFGESFLFNHLMFFLDSNDFVDFEEGSLEEAKVQEAFQATHKKFSQYQFLDLLFYEEDVIGAYNANPLVNEYWDEAGREFVNKLFSGYESGLMTINEMKWLLQRDFNDQYQFRLSVIAGENTNEQAQEKLKQVRSALLHDMWASKNAQTDNAG